jgi:hypothetical protein
MSNEELQTPSYMIKAASSHRCARCVAPALALAPGHLSTLPLHPMNIEALCAAPPEALTHSPSQMPLSCTVAPQAARS